MATGWGAGVGRYANTGSEVGDFRQDAGSAKPQTRDGEQALAETPDAETGMCQPRPPMQEQVLRQPRPDTGTGDASGMNPDAGTAEATATTPATGRGSLKMTLQLMLW